jgi:hypothetical protein
MENENERSHDALTAFTKSLASLRARLSKARLDAHEFARKITRCSLETCRGTCCYDGASVDEDTADVIRQLSSERASDFAAMGLTLPEDVIERSEWNGKVGKKTATRQFPFRSVVKDYPPHFNETACVFLLDDGRCGLQILSEQDKKHPWYYKPFTCWLQPIKVSDSGIRLYDEATDPFKFPDYDGFVSKTHCGRTSDCGAPAAEVLRQELDFLGKLLDRDLLAEMNAAKKETK